MDSIEFMKEFKRMCLYYPACTECPRDGKGCSPDRLDNIEDVLELVADVEKWSSENPRKTRKQDFLDKYPDATLNEYDVPIICCAFLGYLSEEECKSNCKKCWDSPVGDDEYCCDTFLGPKE